MRPRRFAVLVLLLLCTCGAPPPTPVAAPATPPPPPPVAAVAETVSGSVTVLASALNVRREPSTDAEVVRQLKKGAVLGVVRTESGWVRVRR
jgi:uncharacterized protein YgiM (DUF1202 family)